MYFSFPIPFLHSKDSKTKPIPLDLEIKVQKYTSLSLDSSALYGRTSFVVIRFRFVCTVFHQFGLWSVFEETGLAG